MSASARLSLSSATPILFALASLAAMTSFTAQASENAGITVKSEVPGLMITRLGKLPKAPQPVSPATTCNVLPELKSKGGSLATSLGWGVTGEAKLGPYDAVSFADEFDQSTSGSCEIDQGNVALFNGSQLLAIVYADKNSKLSIGRITAIKDRLRILDGGLISMPVGEIRLAEDQTVKVEPLAAEELVCDGKATVPNVYDKPITDVRRAIMAKGWEPFQSPPPSYPDPSGDDIRKTGIVEATDCSGTGFAYCSYYYHKGDMELSVISFGDGTPTVSGYDVACERPNWHKPD